MLRIVKTVFVCALAVYTVACGRNSSPSQPGAGAGHLYVTMNTMEADNLASAWLIKRFIDPQATFGFVPKGTLITNGIAFDTPDAEFRRYQELSCFQSLLQKKAITNAALLRIGEISHDIEINYWGEKRCPESSDVAAKINAVIDAARTNPAICIEKSTPIFDTLYETMRARFP